MDSGRGDVPSVRLLAVFGVLAAGLVGLELWLGLSFGRAPLPKVLSDLWAGVCFIAAGIAAWRLRPRSAIGRWMLGLGFVILLDTMNGGLRLPTTLPGRELTVLLGVPTTLLGFAIGSQLILSYPTGRLRGRAERRLVTTGFVVSGIGGLLLLLTKTPVPAMCDDWCGPSPISLVADVPLYLGIRSVLAVTWIGLWGAMAALLVRRAMRSTRRQRRVLGFAIVAGLLTALILVTGQLNVLAVYAGRSDSGADMLLDSVVRWAVTVAVPAVFLVGLLRERLEFASVGDLVRTLEQVGAGTVEAALGRALRDPTLRVAFPTSDGLLDVSGLPYEPNGGQSVTPLGGDPPVAVLIHDPVLAENRDLLAAAGAAARLALDNARLHAEVRAQLAEVRASRQRIAAAADSERQRLERDLHDGTQQRLLGVGLALGALRGRLGSDTERAQVAELERELRVAIRELRDLAQGIRPAVLTDQGLGPALAGLARRAAVLVSLDVRLASRLTPIVEATAYYVVSEALQNVVKHAQVNTARVRVVHEAGSVAVEVADDGPGGASPRTGTGLCGLADRVDAVGGRFEIESPPGGGTLLRAVLPCPT